MELVIVKCGVNEDISELERKHSAVFIDGEILPDRTLIARLMPVSSLEFVVNVWNCQASVHIVERENGSMRLKEEIKPDADPELFERLVDSVVYDDNDGAINMSGLYFPKSGKSVQLFRKLLAGAGKSETGRR